MKRYRKIASIVVILLTFAGFIYYFHAHPKSLDGLKHLRPYTFIWLLFLYGLTALVLVLNLRYSLAICDKKIGNKENLLLTIYSTVANFFGPLQSGPGVRAIYLKKRHALSVKSFILVSLIYYCFFAIISAFFLVAFSRPIWQTILLMLAFISLVILGLKIIKNRLKLTDKLKFEPILVIKLFLATFVQLAIVAIIYFTELKVVNSHISITQAITYTGAADFALFVSLTPGALGFRESFLLFSERLHHISTSNVLAASLIDRAIYLVFLGILLVVAVLFHARDRLKLSTAQPEDS